MEVYGSEKIHVSTGHVALAEGRSGMTVENVIDGGDDTNNFSHQPYSDDRAFLAGVTNEYAFHPAVINGFRFGTV